MSLLWSPRVGIGCGCLLRRSEKRRTAHRNGSAEEGDLPRARVLDNQRVEELVAVRRHGKDHRAVQRDVVRVAPCAARRVALNEKVCCKRCYWATLPAGITRAFDITEEDQSDGLEELGTELFAVHVLHAPPACEHVTAQHQYGVCVVAALGHTVENGRVGPALTVCAAGTAQS